MKKRITITIASFLFTLFLLIELTSFGIIFKPHDGFVNVPGVGLTDSGIRARMEKDTGLIGRLRK